jgi:signal transduction histidine kinase
VVPGWFGVAEGSAAAPPWWAAVLLSGISCATLLTHRDRPRTTVAVTTACAVAAAALGYLHTVLSLGPVMVALYSFALRTDRNAVRRCFAVGAAVLLMTTELIAGPADRPLELKTIGPAAWVLLPTALGSSVRHRRTYLDAVRARAEHAERTRDEEARRRVAEERMRIAHKLDDATAQHLALANVQARAVTRLMRTDPDRAHRILADLAATTAAALRELNATVSLLRQADDDPRDLDPPAATAAGLTGSVTTAAAPAARVRLDHSHDRLTITVTGDDGDADTDTGTGDGGGNSDGGDGGDGGDSDGGDTALSPPSPRSGFGLLGMRERAQSVGGRLRAGRRPDGGFEVVAELPLHPHSHDSGDDADSGEGGDASTSVGSGSGSG